MKRRVIGWLLVLAVAVGTAPAIAQAESGVSIEEVDTSTYPQVLLLVTAPSEYQSQELTTNDWIVTEGDIVQTVNTALPIAAETIQVVLVVDTSGSMVGDALDQAKAAARLFIDRLPAGAAVGVVAFGNEPSLIQESTKDLDAASVAIDSLSASGETALFDAILAALEAFSSEEGSRSLVILSDGGDTVSKATQDEAVAAVSGFDGRLFAIELETSETSSEPLAVLATASNGSTAKASDPTELGQIYDRIATRIVSQYVLGYETSSSGPTSVAVRLADEGDVEPTGRLIRLPVIGTPSASTVPSMTTTTVEVSPPTLPGKASEIPRFSSGAWPWVGITGIFLGLVGLLAPLLGSTDKSAGRRVRPTFKTRGSQALEGVTRSLVGAAERATGKKRQGGLEGRLEQAGLKLRPGEYLTSVGALTVLALAVGLAVFESGAMAVTLAVLVILGSSMFLSVRRSRRQKAFEDQLPDILTMLSSTIRTGYAPPQATELVARESANPAKEELQRVVAETRLGRDYIDSLHAAAVRIGSEDFQWIVEALEINRDVGGDVSEILDTVSETIRSRIQLRRTIAALSAEGRLSAWILVFTPIFLAIWLYIRDPEYLAPLVESPLGIGALVFAVVAMVMGIFVVRRIINLKP